MCGLLISKTSADQDSEMAAPVKKRAVNLDEKKASKGNRKESESSDDNFEEGENNINLGSEAIQVDFEGRIPIDSDFHGIKQLLSQLFLKAHINLTELTNLIINQNYVGSVIKQSDGDEEDSDDEDLDVNEVFGITTVINLTEKQKLECIQQLRSLLLELCNEHGSDNVNSLVRSLLADDSKPVGLLINERFVNIPAQIFIPLFKSLRSEINRAVEKKMPFDFSYFILICKLYKTNLTSKKKSKKNKQSPEQEIIWSNPEEEIIDEEAEAKFEFSVEKESDSGLSGLWQETDDEMTPMRRVLFIPASKLDDIIRRVEKEITT